MVKRSKATIGGIIGYQSGVGFKLVFPDKKIARKYKSMFAWILESDNLNVTINRGYYDAKEMK